MTSTLSTKIAQQYYIDYTRWSGFTHRLVDVDINGWQTLIKL